MECSPGEVLGRRSAVKGWMETAVGVASRGGCRDEGKDVVKVVGDHGVSRRPKRPACQPRSPWVNSGSKYREVDRVAQEGLERPGR